MSRIIRLLCALILFQGIWNSALLAAQETKPSLVPRPADAAPAAANAAAPPAAEADPFAPVAVVADDSDVKNRPTLDELMKRLAEHEASYLPYHIRCRVLTHVGETVKPEFRAVLFRDGDPRQPAIWDYAQRQAFEWVRVHRVEKDGAEVVHSRVQRTPDDFYFSKSMTRLQENRGVSQMTGRTRFQAVPPLSGVFSGAIYKMQSSAITLDWEGDDASITYLPVKDRQRGGADSEYKLWLSCAHDWHPRRSLFTQWISPQSIGSVHDWNATQFEKIDDRWRITKSTDVGRGQLLTGFNNGEIAYSIEYEILEAKYGSSVDTEIFKVPDDEDLIHLSADDLRPTVAQKVVPPIDPTLPAAENDKPASNAVEGQIAAKQADEQMLKVYPLKFAQASDIADLLEEIYGSQAAKVKIFADVRTNSLILRSSNVQAQEIDALLLKLDTTPQPPTAESINQDASIAESAAPLTTSTERLRVIYTEHDQLAHTIAEKMRVTEASLGSQHPDVLKLRPELRASVQQALQARQQLHRAELAEFQRRMQRLQHSIEVRDQIADKIVERRVEELLNPERQWDPADELSQASRKALNDDSAAPATDKNPVP